jgi:hypothetical protein
MNPESSSVDIEFGRILAVGNVLHILASCLESPANEIGQFLKDNTTRIWLR